MLPIQHSRGASQTASLRRNSRASHRLSQVRAGPVLWSSTPDAWDAQVEEEEAERRLAHQEEWQRRAQEDASEWRAQVDATHNELLARQKQRAALRDRVQQDAERAKQQQLKRIESVARARAKAKGLATMGLDPEILALSSKFMRLDAVVDQVQARMEEEYGLADVPSRRFAGPDANASLPSRAMPAAAGRWEGSNSISNDSRISSSSSSSGRFVSTSGAARLGPGPAGDPLMYAEDSSSSGPASTRWQQLEASVPPATTARVQSPIGAPGSEPAKRQQQQTEEGAGVSAAPTAVAAPGVKGSGWPAASSSGGGPAVSSASRPVQLQSRAQPRPQPQSDSQGPASSRSVAANPAAVAAMPSVATSVNMSNNRRTGGSVSLQPDASTSFSFPASAIQVQGAYAQPQRQQQLQGQQRSGAYGSGAYGSGVAPVQPWPAQQQPAASTSQRSRPQPDSRTAEASTSSGASGTRWPLQPQEQQWPLQQQEPQQQPQQYQQGQQLARTRQQQPLQQPLVQKPQPQQRQLYQQQYQAPYQQQQQQQQRAQQPQQRRPTQQRPFPRQQVQQQQGRPSEPMPRAGRATADVYYGRPVQAQEPVPWWRQVLNKLT